MKTTYTFTDRETIKLYNNLLQLDNLVDYLIEAKQTLALLKCKKKIKSCLGLIEKKTE